MVAGRKVGEMAMMGRNRRCPRIGARIRAETLEKRTKWRFERTLGGISLEISQKNKKWSVRIFIWSSQPRWYAWVTSHQVAVGVKWGRELFLPPHVYFLFLEYAPKSCLAVPHYGGPLEPHTATFIFLAHGLKGCYNFYFEQGYLLT